LERTRMSETIPAIDKVFGSIMDATIDFSIARGLNPNKTLKNMAPSINALPRESFFLMQISTRIKTIITLTIAGMCSTIDISFYLKRLQNPFVYSRVLEQRLIHQIPNSLHRIKAAKSIRLNPKFQAPNSK
jgi:hypothetical protein